MEASISFWQAEVKVSYSNPDRFKFFIQDYLVRKNVQYPKEKKTLNKFAKGMISSIILSILMPRISLQMQKTHASNH